MTLEELNQIIVNLTSTHAYDLTHGDATLAPRFNIDPQHFYWGLENQHLVVALNQIPGLCFEGSQQTDVDTILVWRGSNWVVVLEPQGA